MPAFKHFKYDAEAFKPVMENNLRERPKLPSIVATDPFDSKDFSKYKLSINVRRITMDKDNAQSTFNEESSESTADWIGDYAEMIEQDAFEGDFPLDTIIEGITNQFNDYINMEDRTNYVDVFYTQMYKSRESVRQYDGHEHPNETMEALDKTYTTFITALTELFRERLTLTITDIEDGTLESPDNEFVFRRLYEFFILGAKENFKSVFASDILPKVQGIQNDTEYFNRVQELVNLNSPLITSVGPTDFLKLRNDVEIIEMFENGKIAGNFLRKYSPKFYQNEEFLVEVINYITMIQQFKSDVVNSVEGFEQSPEISDETKTAVVESINHYLKAIYEKVCRDPESDEFE